MFTVSGIGGLKADQVVASNRFSAGYTVVFIFPKLLLGTIHIFKGVWDSMLSIITCLPIIVLSKFRTFRGFQS